MKIEDIAKKKMVEKAIKLNKVDRKWSKDLTQEVYLLLLEKEDKLKDKDEKEMVKYIFGVVKNQYHSNTSPFYTKYRKENIENIKENGNEFEM